jgi:hypothetical protein
VGPILTSEQNRGACQFHDPAALLPGIEPRYSLDMIGGGGVQSPPGRGGEQKVNLPHAGIQPRFPVVEPVT